MAGAGNFEIAQEGLDRLVAALTRAQTLGVAALTKAMVDEMDKVMELSKLQCPVDTGTLRASGAVQPPVKTGNQVTVTAGYGGAAQGYAIFVHEDLNAHHDVGNAKFLEAPFLERQPQIPRNLAVRVEAALRGLR